MLSRGEFSGRVGGPRVLDILKRYDVKASWFIPGQTADAFPEATRRVADEGHEIGNHGYAHEDISALSQDELWHVIRMGNEALERVATASARAGSAHPRASSTGACSSCSWRRGSPTTTAASTASSPFTGLTGFDEIRLDGPPVWGPQLDLVEVPLSWLMQDFVYYELPNYGTPQLTGSSTPSQVEEIWTTQFDYMYERVPGGVMTLVLHPDAVGWGARSLVLERFIEHVLSKDGARFATAETVATEFRAAQAQ